MTDFRLRYGILLSILMLLSAIGVAQDTQVAQALPVHAPHEPSKVDPPALPENSDSEKGPQVRIVGIQTDVAKRYAVIIPPFPIPPFSTWRKWAHAHEDAVHCVLEWRTETGQWFHGEMRSTHFCKNAEKYRVGWGEFPGTAYDAYGVYIVPGKTDREKDEHGKPVVVTCDQIVECDYHRIEAELRRYAAKYAHHGEPGTGGKGRENVGLGGPAYKPTQNSNTMVNYILRRCGLSIPAPCKAVGWDSKPLFPYSSNTDAPALECQP